MIIALPGVDNIVSADLVNAAGVAITAGTVSFYLVAENGVNAGKWYDKDVPATWNAASKIANLAASSHKANGHWTATIQAAAWVEGTRYMLYAHETVAELDIPVSQEVYCTNIPDAICDEYISPADHVVPGSLADRILKSGCIVKNEGQATDAGADTITLAATASTVADIYCQDLLTIIYGTGIGQSRLIVDYSTERVAKLDRPWEPTAVPVAGSWYQVTAFSGLLYATTGTAAAIATNSMDGLTGTFTFATSALDIVGSYKGCALYISAGTGAGQTRLITEYTAGRVATVAPKWDTLPDTTSAYKVIPVGRSIVEALSQAAIDSVKTIVLPGVFTVANDQFSLNSEARYTIDLPQNSSPVLACTLTDKNGTAVNLTGLTLVMKVFATIAGALLFQLTSTPAAGITITNAALGQFSMTFSAANLATAGTYLYELWDSLGDVWAKGQFIIRPSRGPVAGV